MLKIRLWHLRAYQAIINTGTITAAAKTLHITQPAVSRLLAKLELELGFSLFDRQGRHLVATDEGREFYKRVEGTLAGIESLSSIAIDIMLKRESGLRICAIGPLLFGKFLPEGLRRLEGELPQQETSIEWRDRMDIDNWIASHQADIGFTMLPVKHPSLQSKIITTVAAVAVVPKGHRLASKEEITPEDIVGESLIMPKRYTRIRRMAEAVFLDSGKDQHISIETSTALTTCHLVAAGLGIGISDPFSVSGLGKDAVTVCRWAPQIRMTYGALWHRDRELSARAMRLIELLTESTEDFKKDMPQANIS